MAEDEEAQKYEVLQKIGQGSFGIIRKVRHRSTSRILCRKEISYSRMSDRERAQLASELSILSALRHPNIVQYYHRQHIKATSDLHLYMEYCGNGDLGGYIKGLVSRGEWAEEGFVWGVFAQLVGALYRCHYGVDAPAAGEEVAAAAKGRAGRGGVQSKAGHRVILHRDLKPENVFLGTNNAVKLGDFGLSKIIAAHDFASTYVGTPFYMSPEICAAERYSHHSDVWSLGCIIYELAARTVPFDARSHVELVMKIRDGKLKALPAERYSQGLWECVRGCLAVNPLQRPDMAALLLVPQIREARVRLEQGLAVERATQEREATQGKLEAALRRVGELELEVLRLRDVGKKVEMEWHAKATLAIDQRVAEAERRVQGEFRLHKAGCETLLRQQFDAAVEQQVEEKLKLHLASLPLGQNQAFASQAAAAAAHVRSSTPPPGNAQVHSFATTATTTTTTTQPSSSNGSSLVRDTQATPFDTTALSSLSLTAASDNETSPLAQRISNKPATLAPLPTRTRQLFGRAKTLAAPYGAFDPTAAAASPLDVHMAEASPVGSAPMSIKGLSLSPRRGVRASASGGVGARRNIFALAAERRLRPCVAGEVEAAGDDAFADDDDDDDDGDDGYGGFGSEELRAPESPSRPCSGASNARPLSSRGSRAANLGVGGDPFKALASGGAAPKRSARPSLGRQQTMPVSLPQQQQQQQQQQNARQRSGVNMFNLRPVSRGSPIKGEKEKENRPPSSSSAASAHGAALLLRSNMPVATAAAIAKEGATATAQLLSPKRTAPLTTRDGRVLTPSRRAPAPPPPPGGGPGLPKSATAGNLLAATPGKASAAGVRGRTLVELAQNRVGGGGGGARGSLDVMAEGLRVAMMSPAKWCAEECGEEMPSPFLARKGRMVGR
ncbi:hypothetical protein LTR08_001925 [Meristemomyces frigidus]|nr:hypothetical protein LTR08_001925 [Meristemomyces frigidus]